MHAGADPEISEGGGQNFESQVRVRRGTTAEAERPGSGGRLRLPEPHIF